MDHRQVGKYWNENAQAWTTLARAGFDVYRDRLNTPAFLAMLPEIEGLRGLDIGCGEGHNTRLLAQRGARMTAIDVALNFIHHARAAELQDPRGIDYQVASAVELPFADESFDFAAGFMSFMDIPETASVLGEACRVLKPGGFLQFSVCHPCFDTAHRRNVRDAHGLTRAVEVGGYFRTTDGEIDEWIFSAAPSAAKAGLRKFKVPLFRRTLSQWLNLLVESGLGLERVCEPTPDDETVRRHPTLQDAQVVGYSLILRARKPSSFAPHL
jgi:ubiquinone/menaquinone biosynthesis C-methylase UbiE